MFDYPAILLFDQDDNKYPALFTVCSDSNRRDGLRVRSTDDHFDIRMSSLIEIVEFFIQAAVV